SSNEKDNVESKVGCVRYNFINSAPVILDCKIKRDTKKTCHDTLNL
ncbi:hypothetical protein J2Z81_003158, partial [Virgibacillus campisalis]|nr:hypothetical protein [Virgibacillus alimentarius]